METAIVVTGAPGSGKTTLCAHLARALEVPVALPGGNEASRQIDAERYASLAVALADRACSSAVVETCAYGVAWRGEAGRLLVTVDAVAAARGMTEDIKATIRQADMVILTKGDLVDRVAARAAVSGVAECAVIEAEHGKIALDVLPEFRPRPVCLPDNTHFETWGYAGVARLDAGMAERLLKNRPKGAARIKGRVLAGGTGLLLDQSGRARSVTPCEAPEETLLFAAGQGSEFRESDMALHFAEIASAGAASAGWFGFR